MIEEETAVNTATPPVFMNEATEVVHDSPDRKEGSLCAVNIDKGKFAPTADDLCVL